MNNRTANKLLRQKAVYWASPVSDGYGGYTYADPVEIHVLWSDRQEKFINNMAEENLSRAVVMTDQDVTVKGMLSLGLMSDLSSSELPADNNAFEIHVFAKIPDRSGTTFTRKVWL